MKLPVINVPEYEVELKSVGVVKYRPFLVKEQKVLLMAAQAKDNNGIINALRTCVQSCAPDVDVSQLPYYDLAYLFLKIRAKSVGEIVRLKYDCSCGEEIQFEVNVDEIKIDGDISLEPIQLTDSVGVRMRPPTVDDGAFLLDLSDPNNQLQLVASCIDCVYSDDQVVDASDISMEDKLAFLENLTDKQLARLVAFFEQQPMLIYRNKFKCPSCGKETNVVLKDAVDFF